MRKVLLYVTALLALTFTSCQQDTEPASQANQDGINLCVEVEDTGVGMQTGLTRAIPVDPVDGEEKVAGLYLLFFEYSTDGSGRFKQYVKVNDGNAVALNQNIPINFEGANSGRFSILAFANADNYTLRTEGTSLTDFLASLTPFVTEVETMNALIFPGASIAKDQLFMSGSAVKNDDEQLVKLKLTRGVCRFDVQNLAAGFDLHSVSIYNAGKSTQLLLTEKNASSQSTGVKEGKFYGKDDLSGDEVLGGFYAFENYVANPKMGDQLTTCLVIGLVPEGGGNTQYYRININPEESGQALKRNYVYQVSVREVFGPGKASEEDAYTATTDPELGANINNWNMDDEGMILTDGKNTLAVPSKIIRFTQEGGKRTYTIFTQGEGTLTMTTSLPNGLSASLSGNQLTVEAGPLGEQNKREGTIDLKFAGLKGTVQVIQEPKVDHFLRTDKTSMLGFPAATTETYDEVLTINGSKNWNGQIYNIGGSSFSFEAGSLKESIDDQPSGPINLYVSSNSTSDSELTGYLLISLKDVPGYSRVILLRQNGTGKIELTPDVTSIEFDQNGNPLNGVTTTFDIAVDDGKNWEIIKTGANISQFNVDVAEGTGNGQFTITANPNTTEKGLSAVFRIRLKNFSGVFKEISVTQLAHSLSLSPDNITGSISAGGGNSGDITVSSSGEWEAKLTVENGTAYFGTTPGLDTTTGNDGDKFNVTFAGATKPGVSPKATVTVTLKGTSISKIITIDQAAFPMETIYAQSFNLDYASWGTNWTTSTGGVFRYFSHVRDILKDPNNFGPAGVVYTGNQSIQYKYRGDFIPADGVRIGNLNAGGANLAYWVGWLRNTETHFALVSLELYPEYGIPYLKQFESNYAVSALNAYQPRDGRRYAKSAYEWCRDNGNRGAALWNYLLKDGPFKKSDGSPVDVNNVSYINFDAHNRILTQWPSTLIPLIMGENNFTSGKDLAVSVGIDPTHRMLVNTDFELFGNVDNHQRWSSMSEDSQVFLKNIVAYIVNVAIYGDTFSDQFR